MAVVEQQAPIGSEQKMAAAFSSDDCSMTSCLSSLYSLEQEDMFINDLLSDKGDSPRFLCRVCDEGACVTSRCRDCNEALCDGCVRAHLRVRLTKDHFIQRVEDVQGGINPFYKPTPSVSPPGNSFFCDLHITEIVRLYCETCNMPICSECVTSGHIGHTFIYFQDAIDNARKSSMSLLSDIRATAVTAKENMETTHRMLDTMNLKANSVAREIRNLMRRYHLALEERERELINRVERIRLLKGKMFSQHLEEFRLALSRCGRTHDMLNDAMEGGSSYDLLQAKNQAVNELNVFKQLRLVMQPFEDDNIIFYPPDQALFGAVATMGNVTSPSFGPGGGLGIGEGILCSMGNELGFGNSLGENILGVPDHMSASSLSPMEDNVFAIPFRPKIEDPRMQMLPRKKNIPKPFVRSRNYTEAGPTKLTFGSEGDSEGALCRPWGVCCDRNNNIIVADRSNNRIQIFSINGVFLRMFGRHGSEPGEFDRPAGVAADSKRIVVADKDNHRIQIFTLEGEFIHMFGEKGSKNGQFNYPWDVDIDVDGRIVVSDTRNHRIQLFAPDGTFINKYGYENTSTMWKHFDSPRGVCFGFNGMVIVTDFNNHRLVLIDANFRNARFLGSEGTGAKEFLRPQGVAVDRSGYIVVADSRNHRIQVFEANGSFLWQFGESGKEEGQLDRPSGICLTNDGQIVVVDFGNNRIQMF